ncbi:two-component sensor CbrA [Marinobacterium nitratireducens]|uniref:histidine kinase n=1 Tax=Marinobacterium nitratireducens TaxID=518897 RepID=A0A917ZR68_9GAMM|nr:ATP-binding protein [Marinobacterium nitratireducens]GGO88575.1 two-component sensor CbrA [Marinobacterium nitratireducens]
MFSFQGLFAAGVFYLLCLFGTAWLSERDLLPRRLVNHPLVHTLSLGVFASAWTFYGVFGIILDSGIAYLSSYLGATFAFVLAPAIMVPILRITRTHQLSSLADLFAFRFRSGPIGTLTSLLVVMATLPLIAVQIQAVADSLHLLSPEAPRNLLAATFCAVMALFAILFGARHASLRNRNTGLVVAMAVESVVKVLVLLAIAAYGIFGVLGGPSGLQQWLTDNPEALRLVQQLPESDNWHTLLLAFFSSAILMPHMFHLAFTENSSVMSLQKASWMMPFYLLLMALAIPPIVWAAMKLGITGAPEYVILHIGMAQHSNVLTLLAFIGGLSAASGIIIVATVSMASMLQNHLLLPITQVPDNIRLYNWLLWLRRILILVLMSGSYLCYTLLNRPDALYLIGLLAFVTFLHFLPALLATLFWAGINRWGFVMGLSSGIGSWLLAMYLSDHLDKQAFNLFSDSWHSSAVMSLLLNCVMMVLGSRLCPTTEEERRAGDACMLNVMQQPVGVRLNATRVEDFEALLRPRLGAETANRELQTVLAQLGIGHELLSPLDLLRLRTQLEQHLSGLLGPVEAATLLEPLEQQDAMAGFRARDVHLLESQLEQYHQRLGGLAAELDELRRYHRLTLQKLPVGVCTLDSDGRILFWNAEIEQYTDLRADDVLNWRPASLPAPWGKLLTEFADGDLSHKPSHKLEIKGHPRWFSLHKAQLSEEASHAGMVILLEDETETLLLADKLAHHERLASIGRFAAGVAHEIGNPVTGIACLAQNLKLESDDEPVLETGKQILDQTKRISRIVQSLVRFAHAGRQEHSGQHEPMSLHECIAEALHLVSLDSRGTSPRYSNEVPVGLEVMGDAQQLLQIFVNLLNNACDATPDQGLISVSAEREDEKVIIRILDEGTGIPPELQDRLFEPFFTTKDPGKGTGLGLPLVYNIIEEHYGNIEIISPANKKQNKGTLVVITLPGTPVSQP